VSSLSFPIPHVAYRRPPCVRDRPRSPPRNPPSESLSLPLILFFQFFFLFPFPFSFPLSDLTPSFSPCTVRTHLHPYRALERIQCHSQTHCARPPRTRARTLSKSRRPRSPHPMHLHCCAHFPTSSLAHAPAASTLTSYRTPRQLAALPCRPSPETRVPASVTTPVAAEQCRLPAAGPSPLIPLSKLHCPSLPLAVLPRCTC